jgi:hypothetical protein
LIAVAVVPAEAHASPKWIFATPGQVFYCGMAWKNTHLPLNKAPLRCYRRRDGRDVEMGRTGKPRITSVQRERGQRVDAAYHLAVGHQASLWGFHCTLRRTGLTCTNPAKHGFWLGSTRGSRNF